MVTISLVTILCDLWTHHIRGDIVAEEPRLHVHQGGRVGYVVCCPQIHHPALRLLWGGQGREGGGAEGRLDVGLGHWHEFSLEEQFEMYWPYIAATMIDLTPVLIPSYPQINIPCDLSAQTRRWSWAALLRHNWAQTHHLSESRLQKRGGKYVCMYVAKE